MRTTKHLALAAMAAAALALAGCGGGGGSSSSGPPSGPKPIPAMGSVTLGDRAQAALLAVLPTSGSSDTIEIAAGETAVRAGVTFRCASDYACTVTVTNSLGTITAQWSSQRVGDGTAGVTASLPHVPVNTFAELNPGNAASIRTIIAATTPTLRATEITGMGLGGRGAVNDDMLGLRSSLDPNSANAGGTAGAPGAANGLTGGSTLAASDGIPLSADMAPPPAGWELHALFRDWGDTAGTGDGGFETGAIVVENMGPATTHPWDADLAGRFVNPFNLPGVVGAGNNPYQFTVDRLDADGDPGSDGASDTVAFTVDAASDTPGGEGSHVNANVAGAGALAITVTSADDGAFRTVMGQFLGVNGVYTCGTTDCALRRDSGTDNFTLGAGNWQFTPAAGAMVSVPDQDWMAYGAWMTTPDNAAGPHRVGRFYNGFDSYDAGSNFDAGNEAGLHGTAEYNGGAAGVYVDGTASGLFTATATLTANFDVNGNASEDTGDYTISGRIHDFRGTDGVYLGSDTAADPNDPDAGGENDWVVLLNSSTLGEIGTASVTAGSADGLPWAGQWSGTLFGPATAAPSGVAGQFRASTAAAGAVAAGNTAVAGTFGATHTPSAN